MGRGVKPYRGGGAGGGQVEIPGSRPQIKAERVKVTNKTVGDGLVDTLSGLSDSQIKEFGETLRAAAREADAGDPRAAQAYGLALNKLSGQGVDGLIQWGKIVNATTTPPFRPDPKSEMGEPIPMTKAQFAGYFQNIESPRQPVKDVTDAQAFQLAEDAPPANNQRILPKNMPLEGVSPGIFDPSLQLADAVGGELSAQGMPVVERTPMVSPHSWAQILGSSEAAEGTRIRGRAPNSSLEMFPQLARFDNIRYLAQQTGLPFQAAPGAPAPQGVVKRAFDMIDEAQDESGNAAVKYDFTRKAAMRRQAEQMVTQEVMDDPSIPATDKARVIQMRTQELLDRMPVGTYPDELGPRLKELLMAGDQPDPNAPAPVYQGSDFDPVVAQAALDEVGGSEPAFNEGLGYRSGPGQWQQEVPPIDTNLLGGAPSEVVSPLARLIGSGDENVVPALRYAVGLPGYGAKNLAEEFAGMNRSRSPLEKAIEEHNAVLMGQAPTPRVVQGLLNRSGDENIVRMIQQNLGSIYDLDNRTPNWRRGINFPLGGVESAQLPIPPDVLAGLYARQLGINDPNVLAQMVEPMTVSSDVIGSVKPTGRAGSMLRAGGGYVEPLMYKVGVGGRGGVSAQQAAELKAMLLESIQMNSQRLKDMGRTPPIMFPTKPKNQPPIINMQGASLMPESSRFDNSRVNPLMRLVG